MPLDLINETAHYTVLATGLDSDARWYGRNVFKEIFLGNGVDDDLIAQLGRTVAAEPHMELRKAGTNSAPGKPVIRKTRVNEIDNAQATWVIDGVGEAARASGVVLTFVANDVEFRGEAGNNIRVRILHDPYGSSISMTRSGSGTQGDPYEFTINTAPGGSNSSNNAIVTLVTGSTAAFGILECTSAASNDAEDTGSWSMTSLSGGVDESDSVGFLDTEKTVYLRYWDPGTDGFGYEGPSSEQSEPIIFGDDENDAADIQVAITGNPLADGGRFGFIRIYLQFGTGDDAIWNLVDQTPNDTFGTRYVSIGTDAEIGQPMSLDQSRPLPSRYAAYGGQKVWKAGILEYPTQVSISKSAVEDELVPEGMNQDNYISVPGQTEEAGRAEITALFSDEQYIHVHTTRGITLVSPSELSRFNAPVQAGAMNQNMLVQWERARSFYLSLGLVLYDFNGARYGKRDAADKSVDAATYLRDRVNEDALDRNADRCWMLTDTVGQILWFWLPDDDGNLLGFVYDTMLQGIAGPFDFPRIYASCRMEANRPEIICADEVGNLFVWNPSNQADHGDSLPTQDAFTARSLAYTPPAEQNGWDVVTYSGAKYTQAADCVMETGMLDMGDGSGMKAFRGLTFRSIPNSRALVEITFIGASGRSVTRTYGDVGEYQSSRPHKVTCGIHDTAMKVRFRFICAEQKTAIFRDFSVLWEKLGRA